MFEGWTKGFLFTHEGGEAPVICHKYYIRKTQNEMFLFLEVDFDNKSYINVLKKVFKKEYILNEIGVHDNIDLPFVKDDNVIGLWKSVDFVDNINCFYATNQGRLYYG